MTRPATKEAKKERRIKSRFGCPRCGQKVIKHNPDSSRGRCPQCHQYVDDPRG